MGRYQDALADFHDVIQYSDKQRGGGRNKLVLKREATRDLVKTMSILTSHQKKHFSFSEIAPTKY